MDPDNLSLQRELEDLKHRHALEIQSEQRDANESLERLKHALSMERDSSAQDARARELHFLEAGQSIRSLNVFMWQVPGIAIAVTGGLWYGASTIVSDIAKTMVLLFAFAIDLLLIVIIFRVRYLIQQQLDRQTAFQADKIPTNKWRYLVVIIWTLLLVAAASISITGALNPDDIAQRQNNSSVKSESPYCISPCQFPKQESSVNSAPSTTKQNSLRSTPKPVKNFSKH